MYLLVLVTKFAYIEVYQTTTKPVQNKYFFENISVADGLQHIHETNRINIFFTKYLRIFFGRHFYIFVAPNLSKKILQPLQKRKKYLKKNLATFPKL